jgi:hypothetical protein
MVPKIEVGKPISEALQCGRLGGLGEYLAGQIPEVVSQSVESVYAPAPT